MAALKFDAFGGLAPIFDPRKLPEGLATIADNCRFDGGDLRPWDGDTVVSPGPSISGVIGHLKYAYGEWLAWPRTHGVDAVSSPVPQDEYRRVYWTRKNSYPRASSQLGAPGALQSEINSDAPSSTGVNHSLRRLGMPKPPVFADGDVAVDQAEATASTSARPSAITKASPAVVTFAAAHPFSEGQRIRITITSAEGNMKEISGKEFIVADPPDDTPAAEKPLKLVLRGSNTTTYSAFTNPNAAMVDRVLQESDIISRAYVYTYVSNWGEEGAPNVPSDVVDVRYDGHVKVRVKQYVRPAGETGVDYAPPVAARVYRTQSGTGGATEYFFVKEQALTAPSHDVTDDTKDEALGEVLPSLDWTSPVSGMEGLTIMPNGFAIAFKGNTLYASEPYMLHAWPDSYRKTADFDIVGTAVYGQTAVIATKGKPSLAGGVDPSSLQMQQLDLDAPCINKRSVVSVGSGVVFATYDGLAFVSASGSRIVTQEIMRKDQWMDYWSESMECVYHDGHYLALSDSPAKPSLSFFIEGGKVQLCKMSRLLGHAPTIRGDNDTMVFAKTTVGDQLYAFAADTSTIGSYSWKSKVYTLPKPASFAAAQVFAGSYPVFFRVHYGNLLGDGSSPVPAGFYVASAVGPEPFRLPAGVLSREWQIEFVAAGAEVQSVVLGTSMDEIRAL